MTDVQALKHAALKGAYGALIYQSRVLLAASWHFVWRTHQRVGGKAWLVWTLARRSGVERE